MGCPLSTCLPLSSNSPGSALIQPRGIFRDNLSRCHSSACCPAASSELGEARLFPLPAFSCTVFLKFTSSWKNKTLAQGQISADFSNRLSQVRYLTYWKGHESCFLDKLSSRAEEMLRIKYVWFFPLCLILKNRGQQSDDLSALEIRMLLERLNSFLKRWLFKEARRSRFWRKWK